MSCIICNQSTEHMLDLGKTPLANRFLAPDQLEQEEPSYPLRLGRCTQCGHVQLLDPVPPTEMFDEYLYVSGYSQTLTEHLHSVATMLTSRLRLKSDDLVVDIGANDGTLLSGFPTDLRRIGVEPAENLHELAEEKGLTVFPHYFDATTGEELSCKFGRTSLITSTNSFPHIPDLHGFFSGIIQLLADDGVLMIEAHYLRDMYEQVAFDTIYHEHVSYWHLSPLMRLLDQFGLEVFDCERLDIHHGQLRIFIQFRGKREISPNVGKILAGEKECGLDTPASAYRFAQRAEALKEGLRVALNAFQDTGKRVVGYGAPAKGNTLIHYLGITRENLPYIADRSELKQGRLTPGSHIPIVAPSYLLEDQPDYVLILAWNFTDEIVAQLRPYAESGGRFVVPIPEFRVLETAIMEANG